MSSENEVLRHSIWATDLGFNDPARQEQVLEYYARPQPELWYRDRGKVSMWEIAYDWFKPAIVPLLVLLAIAAAIGGMYIYAAVNNPSPQYGLHYRVKSGYVVEEGVKPSMNEICVAEGWWPGKNNLCARLLRAANPQVKTPHAVPLGTWLLIPGRAYAKKLEARFRRNDERRLKAAPSS